MFRYSYYQTIAEIWIATKCVFISINYSNSALLKKNLQHPYAENLLSTFVIMRCVQTIWYGIIIRETQMIHFWKHTQINQLALSRIWSKVFFVDYPSTPEGQATRKYATSVCWCVFELRINSVHSNITELELYHLSHILS